MLQSKVMDEYIKWCQANLDQGNIYAITAEECAELIQACMKMKRTDQSPAKQLKNRDNPIEEMAHVMFTVESLRQQVGITQEQLEEKVLIKYKKYGIPMSVLDDTPQEPNVFERMWRRFDIKPKEK